ncbi:hypothetical protein QBC32DRAFT_389541 [Pseudoneurospora amorphoporcata]|uniref:Transmembrane protein n=1 Tax=Pseudoneurospora amorphoporcata TaxID=241081 RepID=A0AAN6SGS5_9PEZI|nr:hypothetical protein QBC32DRAFT_389541 [Pseudoneurospora amorphoporcata]
MMHPPRFIRFALTLLITAAISAAVLVPKSRVSPSGAPEISKRNTDAIHRSQQPPAAVAMPTVYHARGGPVRARERNTRFAGRKREIIPREDGGRARGAHYYSTEEHLGERNIRRASRAHRRDVAGMATPGFAILVVFAAIAFIALTWFTVIYCINKGETAAVQ